MSATVLHYKSNLRDVYFNLFEVLDIERTTLGRAPFVSMDGSTARDALKQLATLAETEIAPSFADTDRTPLTLDADGNVHLPESLKKSMKAWWDGSWHLFEVPEHIGGFGAPPTIWWSAFEMIAGAHASFAFYTFGSFVARVIDHLGTDAQKRRFVQPMLDGRWGGTMVLTEPDAGSDVGAARAKARPMGDGLWEIEGTKRFITNGDFDSVDNIVHLVLARPEGAGPGTKGLSMFIVPKWWVAEDGTMTTERNGVYCTNIEKKMGIKGSSTCELTFGEKQPARGFLVGEAHDGIRQMFRVIEQARMAVGVKSMATLSTAYLNALAYTKERVQGGDLLRVNEKASPRVRIIDHPDVRRMLMSQKAFAEGLRALALYAASIQDQVEILGGHGAKEAEPLERLNDLLLPLVKGYGSEKVYELLSVSLQCFGGSGYCQDYPIEQYIRDQKIDSLYEGTTHIQAQDLFFRKVARDGGATLRGLLGEVQRTISTDLAGDALAVERQALERASADLQGIYGAMLPKMQASLYHVGFQANRVLSATGELVIGWRLCVQAAIAQRKLATATGKDVDFYTGKLAAVRWYCQNVLPGLTLTRKLVEAGTLELMDVPEAAF